MLEKLSNDVMSTNDDNIVIFPIYSQFGAIWKPYSWCKVHKSYFSINNHFYSKQLKTELKTLKHLISLKKGWRQQDLGGHGSLYSIFFETKFVSVRTNQNSNF